MRSTNTGFEQNIPLLLFIQRSGVPAIEICRDLISRKGLAPARCVGTVALESYPCTVVSDLEFENREDLMVKYRVDSESIGFTRDELMSADFVTANISGAAAIVDALFALRPVTVVQVYDTQEELISRLVSGGMTPDMARATVEHEETSISEVQCNLSLTFWGHTVEEISDSIMKYQEYRRDMFVKRLAAPVPKPEVQEVRVRYPKVPILLKFFIAILVALFMIAQLLTISCLTSLMGQLGEIQWDLNNMEVKYYALVEELESVLDASIDEPGSSNRPEIKPNSFYRDNGVGQRPTQSYQVSPYCESNGCITWDGDYTGVPDKSYWDFDEEDGGPITTERERAGEAELDVSPRGDGGTPESRGAKPIEQPESFVNSSGEQQILGDAEEVTAAPDDSNRQGSVISNSTAQSLEGNSFHHRWNS